MRCKCLSRKAFGAVVRGLLGALTRTSEATPMNRLRRDRMRSAYLHLFAMLMLLPAILPLPYFALLVAK